MARRKTAVTVETGAQVREVGKYREIFVTVEPSGLIGLRLKGLRTTEYYPADVLYYTAVKARVAREKKEKKRK